MKNLFTILIIYFFLIACSSNKDVIIQKINPEEIEKNIFDFSGKIDKESLNFIKENYFWNNEEVLVINFRQPKNYCHFNNSYVNSESINFQKKFYAKINTADCLIINVLSNRKNIKNKLKQKKYFIDKNKYLLNNYFSRKRSCFGVLVINKIGNYFQYNGHYSEKQVAKYIYELKK